MAFGLKILASHGRLTDADCARAIRGVIVVMVRRKLMRKVLGLDVGAKDDHFWLRGCGK
jgi:hypothetical protein